MAIGQISGPLLSQNLTRDGVNLSFDTDLVFLDVINRQVGVNTQVPGYDLDVNGLLHTTNMIVDNYWVFGNVTGSAPNNITTTIGNLNIGSGSTTVVANRLISGNVQIKTNVVGLASTVTNGNLYLNPSSLQTNIGTISHNNNVLVQGNLHATGDITADGNIVLGTNQPNDTVTLLAEITSDLIPKTDITYNVGTNSLRWKNIWTYNFTDTTLNSTNVNSTTLTNIGDLSIQANTITSLNSNEDINLSPKSGFTYAENILFFGSEITQNTTSQNLIFSSVGTGYYQFVQGTTSAIAWPAGTTAQEPATGQTGQLRYNTQRSYLEIYNGTTWTIATGPTAFATLSDTQDLSVIWQLVLD